MTFSAVIFDYDYTLANSEKGIVNSFYRLFEEEGAEKISEYAIKRTIGYTLEDAFTELLGVTDRAELARLNKRYVYFADQLMVDGTALYSGVENLLLTLRACGVKVGIVSSKTKRRILQTLEPKEITVDGIVGRAEVQKAKPSPEGLNLLIKRFRVKKSEVLYVGDSMTDAQTALNAGVAFAGVTQGVTTEEELSRFPNVGIVSDVAKLFELIH